MRFSWLVPALLLSLVIAVLQRYALANFLYWYYPWFDVPMHLLGGVVIATVLVAFLHSCRPLLFVILAAAIFTGWEVFEFALGFPRELNYVFDTSLDLLNDAIGAVLVYALARFTVWR